MTDGALTLVALAAGLSTRFGRLKQLEPLGPGGETLLEYSTLQGALAGFRRLLVVVSPENESTIRDALGERLARHLPVEWCVQRMEDNPGGTARLVGRTKPWGTAHAVYTARGRVSGPFGVVNADDWYGADALSVLATALQGGLPGWHLVTYPLDATLSESGGVSRAVCTADAAGLLIDIEELRDVRREPGGRLVGSGTDGTRTLDDGSRVSLNLWGLDTRFFAVAERELGTFVEQAASDHELALPDVIRTAVAEGSVPVHVHPGGTRWVGVTHSADRDRAARELRALGEGPRSAKLEPLDP